MDTTPDTNAEVNKKITEYYLNMVQYDKLTIENFDDEELREKYKTLNREEFKKISELLKESGKKTTSTLPQIKFSPSPLNI